MGDGVNNAFPNASDAMWVEGEEGCIKEGGGVAVRV